MKKTKSIVIIAIVAVLLVVAFFVLMFAGVFVSQAFAPELTPEKAKEMILEQIEPQLGEIREKHDIPDLSLEIEFTTFEYTAPKLFENGLLVRRAELECEFIDYYVSSTFSELDEEGVAEKLFYRYSDIPEIDYIGIASDRYELEISRDYDEGGSGNRFKTENEDVYCFIKTNIADMVEKNGETIYMSKLKSTGKQQEEKCHVCNGTGLDKYYYGSSDMEAYLDGHEASWYGQCGSCGGTGIAKK